MSFHLKDSVDSSHTELLSKKDRKLQANELKRAQDALEAFAKKNPEHASDAEQAKQFAKLTAKVAKLTQITTGVRPLETQDKLVFFIVAFLVALLPACTSISFHFFLHFKFVVSDVYLSIYDLAVGENWLVYLSITGALIYFLGEAYGNYFSGILM
jgi:hypothetical protein